MRVCIDPSDINKNLIRRYHPLRTVEEIAGRIKNSKFFTLLDCKKGFWQVKLSKRSQKLLTMATPWGRFSYTRLPFGLASASEVFQDIMSSLLEDVENVEVSIDDILIHAKSKKELQTQTEKVISKLSDAGLKLNKEKCIFCSTSRRFLGHILTSNGLQVDQDKVEAI